MLLSQQPRGCIGPNPALRPQPTNQYQSTKLFNSLLSPPAVTACIEVRFTSVSKTGYWPTDPFDMGLPPQPSPELQTSQRTNTELRTDLRRGSERWKDDELEILSITREKSSESQSTQQQKKSPNDDIDVFEVQEHPELTPPNSRQLEGAKTANKLGSLDLSLANGPLADIQPSPDLPATHSTDTQAVSINKRRLHSPTPSPQRDPRSYFGSRETHLPWVTKLSPNRFSMAVSPDMLSPDAPPPKSIWDADDDEFDRWPTAAQAREELDTMRRNATTKRSTFVGPATQARSVADQLDEAVRTPMGDVTRTASEQEQTIRELEDMDCGNVGGQDLHDDIIVPFRSHDYPVLPAHAPARHMHVLDAKAYTSCTDAVAKAARPRLCDAVATVLAYTSPECLADFLNPEVEVFEWRRLINCVMIRREGNQVVVGNYYNFGTTYQWGYLVRATIDEKGAWTETWASVSQGTTAVGKERVLFEQFLADGSDWGVEPDDQGFALYVGRQLSHFLLSYEVWNYYKWWRYRVEWEANGKVTDAREKNRYPAGLIFD
ncbi:hypothetical protein C7974DRAFT_401496 [Boeremia exigua]|uniref:uncharacterized protein n=1 Tax=Boeremia exigua TaxID=749465 RepID=UPI001E8EAB31|nr:uncharacterized protein C7974DRAFT_401496 [Boeremia exigua]KAH6616269.1 hypothetical protein C7974DRAFT_401496 [Boeremia exigua]